MADGSTAAKPISLGTYDADLSVVVVIPFKKELGENLDTKVGNMWPIRHAVVLVIMSVLALVPTSAAHAESVPIAQANTTVEKEFQFYVVDQPASDFFSILENEANIRIQVPNSIRLRITKFELSGTVPEILDALARELELDWFTYNGIFHISRKADAAMRIIGLDGKESTAALSLLQDPAFNSRNFPARYNSESHSIVVSGPPKFLAIAEVLISAMQDNPKRPPQKGILERRSATELKYVEIRGLN